MNDVRALRAKQKALIERAAAINEADQFDAVAWDSIVSEIENVENVLDAASDSQERSAKLASISSQSNTSRNIKMQKYDTTGRGSEQYRAAFWKALSGMATTPDEARALSVGLTEAGGILIPTGLANEIMTALSEAVVMRKLGTVLHTGSDLDIPIGNQSGVAGWIGEGNAYPESDESFSGLSLSVHKLGTIMKISEELLQDAPALEQYVMTEYIRRVSLLEEEAYLVGTGAGQPTGVIGSATLGVTTAAADDITPDEIIELYHSLPRQYRARASFVLNDGTAMTLRKKKATTGDYVWQPGLGQTPETILGRPVVPSGFMPEIAASAKTVLFGDFSYYRILDRGGVAMQVLREKYADTGHVGLKAHQRVDGHLALPEAVVYAQQHA